MGERRRFLTRLTGVALGAMVLLVALGGCPVPPNSSGDFKVTPETLEFGVEKATLYLQVTQIPGQRIPQPITVSTEERWIKLDTCLSVGENCSTNCCLNGLRIPVAIDRFAMKAGENYGTIVVRSPGYVPKEVEVTATAEIVPGFVVSDRTPYVGEAVTFTDDSDSIADWTISDWVWDFGDGSPVSRARHPEAHTYASTGRYTVALRITAYDKTGRMRQMTVARDNFMVVSEPGAPIADAGYFTIFANLGDVVTLDGTASSAAEDRTLTYSWTLTTQPPDSQATLAGATTATPSFVPDAVGTYIASLVVNDGVQDSQPDEIKIIVGMGNQRPVAVAGADRQAAVGDEIQLDGSASYDPEGDPITYSWAFVKRPENSIASLRNKTSEKPSFWVDLLGTYRVKLVVNDGVKNSEPDYIDILVDEMPVIADAGPDQDALFGDTVTLDGSRSLGENLTYRWAFVSRPIGSAAELYDTAGQQLPDAYTGEARPRFEVDGVGDFVISLTVTDGVDTAGPDTVTVSTTPVANAGPDQQVTVDDRVNLDGSDSLGEEFYLWTLTKPAGSATQLYTGNDQLIYVGTPAITSVATPYFYADRAGTYTVELLVQANNIYSSPDEARVTASSNLRFDPGLEAALLEATGKQPGMLDKYDLQDASLTALDAADAGIQSLDGIEKCVNLESLNLAGNQIADIADLAELQNLNRLNLSGNLVQDVTPIAGLLSLTEVDLTGNPIADFTPLVDSPAIKSGETSTATINSLCDLLERLEGAGVSVIIDLNCPEE